MGAFTAQERDQLAKSIFSRICLREKYAAQEGDSEPAKWVTIGAKNHSGGTPVKLGPGGKILAGPAGMKGKTVDQLGSEKSKSGDKPAWQGLQEDAEAAERAGNLDKAARRYREAAENHPGGTTHREALQLLERSKAASAGKPAGPKPDKLADSPPEAANSAGKTGDSGRAAEGKAKSAPDFLLSQQKEKIGMGLGAGDKSPEISKGRQEAFFHGLDDAAGQGKLFDGLDLAGKSPKPEFELKGRHGGPEFSQAKQEALFDKLQDADSPEAKSMPTASAIARGEGPHRLRNELGETPPPGVTKRDNGIWTGSATLHASDIQMDPKRFQYKISGIGDKGVTKQLADVKRFNPMFGGQLMVWRDPHDGKTYVINGHHRVDLAKRSESYDDPTTGLKWNGEMQAFYIPAHSDEEARAWGAVANMASGHGTATDAAKYLRDSGDTIDGLQKHGVSLRGKIAQDALQLKDLSRRAFEDMTSGVLPESRALAVASRLKDPEKQDRLFRRLAEKERAGENISDQAAANAADISSLAGETSGAGDDVLLPGMGGGSQSLEIEYGQAMEAAQKALASERNTFKAVSSSKRAGRLGEAGNVLDTETNRQRARTAAERLDMFNKLSKTKSATSKALREVAEKIAHEPDRTKQTIGEFLDGLPEVLERDWDEFKSGGKPERYSAQGETFGGSPGANPSRSVRSAAAGYSGTGNHDARALCGGAFRQRLTAALRPAIERAILSRAIRPAVERYAASWSEGDHPRDEGGKFSQKGGGSSAKGSDIEPRVGGSAATSSADYHPAEPIKPQAKQSVNAKDVLDSLQQGKSVEESVSGAMVSHAPAVQAAERDYPPTNHKGFDTIQRHSQGGQWTPQRKALHDSISAKLRANVPRSEARQYLMMGGGPASGKSSVIHSGQVYVPQSVHIDADAIKAELPEYNPLVKAKDYRAACYVHEESSDIGRRVQSESFAASQNVLFDGTGDSSLESVKSKVDKARKAGYAVNAEYVTCSVDEALRRNLERAKKTGRLPPEQMLRDTHKSVSQVVPQAVAAGLFDHFRLWDTEHKDAQGHPVLVASAEGKNLTVHHPELWEAFQAKGNA